MARIFWAFVLAAVFNLAPAWAEEAGEEEPLLLGGAGVPETGAPAPAPADPLAALKDALKNPAQAETAVRELGPKIGTVEAAREILLAGAKHGREIPVFRAACKQTVHKMAAKAEVLRWLLAIRKDPRVDSMGYALAYEVLGDLSIEDGPPASATERSLFEQRREALLDGLKSSYTPIAVSSARAIGKTGDRKAVKRLVDRLETATGEAAGAVEGALKRITGQDFPGPKGWRRWYDTSGGAEFPETAASPGAGNGKGNGGAGPEAWELEYYGIPVRSAKMSFVIDVSESMGPEKNPDPSWFPRPKAWGEDPVKDPANWREGERAFESKIHLAKYELIATILQMPEQTRFNISFFGGRQAFVWPEKGDLIQATPANKGAAMDRVLAQDLALGTPLIEGLEVGWKNPEVDTIFCLSDGQPFHSRVMDPNEVVRIAVENCAGKRKIKVNTIDMNEVVYFFKEKWRRNPPMATMTDLAQRTGGTCVKVVEAKCPFPRKVRVYAGPR